MAEKTKRIEPEKPSNVLKHRNKPNQSFDAQREQIFNQDAEDKRQLILEMQERARKNVGEHEVHSFPLDKEVGGFYMKSERGRMGKKADPDKKPGMIHTLDMGEAGRVRFWGFGIFDFHLEENKIEAGDFIVVTRREKNEKGMWACDFGFAKAKAKVKGGD